MNIVEVALCVLERAGYDVEVEDNIIYVNGEEVAPTDVIGAAPRIRSMQTDI
jgi:hypothetical protein